MTHNKGARLRSEMTGILASCTFATTKPASFPELLADAAMIVDLKVEGAEDMADRRGTRGKNCVGSVYV